MRARQVWECPAGHALVVYRTQHADHVCDVSGRSIRLGELIQRCETCNFDCGCQQAPKTQIEEPTVQPPRVRRAEPRRRWRGLRCFGSAPRR